MLPDTSKVMQGMGQARMAAITALIGAAASISAISTPAAAGAISIGTVAGQDDIYNAINPSSEPGSNPVAVNVTGLSSITFSVSTGDTETINGGGNYNDADGVGAGTGTSSETGANGISGITAPGGGYITGVFLGSTTSTTAPTALDFTAPNGTAFTSLSPLLQQSFFVGDGLTGDATGSEQTFYVPTGATTLYLGISDACSYSGAPGCYSDNSGGFTVSATETPIATGGVPEPATWAMMLFGFGALGAAMRSRRKQAPALA